MADILVLKARPDLAGRVKAIEQEGTAYFPGVLSAAEVAELREAMERLAPLEESFDRKTSSTGVFLNKHINNAFNRDPRFLRCIDLPDIIDLAEAVHGDDCHVIGMTAWMTGPGRPDQKLHCDWLPVALPEETVHQIIENAEKDPGYRLHVDLEAQRVWDESEEVVANFDIEPFRRYSLLNGLDDIGLTLEREGDISRFEARRGAHGGVVTA